MLPSCGCEFSHNFLLICFFLQILNLKDFDCEHMLRLDFPFHVHRETLVCHGEVREHPLLFSTVWFTLWLILISVLSRLMTAFSLKAIKGMMLNTNVQCLGIIYNSKFDEKTYLRVSSLIWAQIGSGNRMLTPLHVDLNRSVW